MRDFKAQFRAAREQKGLTIYDVAKLLDVSAKSVSAWERGTREPSLETIEAWGKCLGMDVRLTWAERPLEPSKSRLLGQLEDLLPTLDAQAVRMLEAQLKALASDDVKKAS